MCEDHLTYVQIIFTFREEDHEYEVPFDFNLRDVTGQTLLYMACCVANIKIIEVRII